MVASSPGSMPSTALLPGDHKKSGSGHHGGGKMSTVAIVAIIVGDVLVLALVSLILYCYFWRNGKSGNGKSTSSSQILEGQFIIFMCNYCMYAAELFDGKFVMFVKERILTKFVHSNKQTKHGMSMNTMFRSFIYVYRHLFIFVYLCLFV